MSHLYGFTAARERNQANAPVITAVEATSTGDILLHVGNVTVLTSGNHSRICGAEAIRLTPDDVSGLIEALVRAEGARGAS